MLRRFLSHQIAEAMEDTPVVLITGARQTGKSTFCRQLQEDKMITGNYITMDDPSILSAAKYDPMGFLLNLGNQVILDEVQRVPEIFISIKNLIDDNRQRRFVLTGSADVMLFPKVADSLAGRMEMHRLWPLSVGEINEQPGDFLKKILSENAKFQSRKTDWKTIIEFIRRGGYPEVVHRKTESRRSKWLEAYLTSILQKDIRDLANMDGLAQIPKILNLLSVRVGSTVNMSDIARLAGIKNTSFQRYMTLLEMIFLIVKIPAWTPNNEGRYVKSSKIFLNDTGLLCHINGDRDNLFTDRTSAGKLLENFVAMEIIKQISWFEKPVKLMHFSMHKGAEVDLVLEDAQKNIYGIEIKSKASLNIHDFKGLRKLEELAGKKFRKGIVLYNGEQAPGGFGGKNLQAVPIANLWN